MEGMMESCFGNAPNYQEQAENCCHTCTSQTNCMMYGEKLNKLSAENAELKRHLAEREWQPIETAPKNGSVILLTSGFLRHADGWWNGTGWVWPYIYSNPTHWMPRPPVPKQGD